ncbi:hypothetical protein [Desulfatiglans anilini]|uniref:hypothetical protein n=1 Tax=Desulfatiglans anilini TaxID=90728 RepID=UPI00129477C8|nr:hypothetical protein [Desulfatiglans anilini]
MDLQERVGVRLGVEDPRSYAYAGFQLQRTILLPSGARSGFSRIREIKPACWSGLKAAAQGNVQMDAENDKKKLFRMGSRASRDRRFPADASRCCLAGSAERRTRSRPGLIRGRLDGVAIDAG